MSDAKIRQALSRRAAKQPRVAVVTGVSLADAQCTVLVSGGEVVADLNDQTVDLVAIGTVVTLLPIGDTYEVISTRGGTGTGGIGTSLGPELLPNGSFEYGSDLPTGWSAYPWVLGNYTAARDATPGESVSGDARALVSLFAGADAPLVRFHNITAVKIDAGSTYQCSAWMKAPAGDASLTSEVWVITAPNSADAVPFGAGSTVHTIASVGAPGAAYQLMTGTFTAPVGDAWACVYLSADADATIAAPVSVSWDLVSLRQRITS